MAQAPINGSTLRWAREAMLVDTEELAKALGTSENRIAEFESGDARPTVRQLKMIAKKLDRTPAFFFTEPPSRSDVPMSVDFRAAGGEQVPSRLAREMRRVEQYRDAVLDLEGVPAEPACVGPIDQGSCALRAGEMRQALGLENGFIPEGREQDVFAFWRNVLESHGYLVFQVTHIELSVFRGLSICHDVLPVVLLNGSDSAYGKAFTLFHEVAHLTNRTSGMCALENGVSEEAVANAFAAHVLMPAEEVEKCATDMRGSAIERVEAVASVFKVSVLAAGVRLRTLGLISEADLSDVRRESDSRWAQSRAALKATPGGPPAWRLRYRDLGAGYVGTVVRALEEDRVDLLDASHLLNARVPMVRQMIDEYYRTEGAA